MRDSRSMSDQHELEERVKTAQAECERLRKENVRLRAMLGVHDPVPEHPVPSAPGSTPTPLPFRSITEASTPEQKIALFRGLFRGREDVYAVRWEGKAGKAGYSPASVMDWRAIHAARAEERKRVARKTRMLLPLTDDAIRNHLTGKQTIGVYPLLPDETCWFLALDFDKKSWMADAGAFLATCRRFQVPAAVERSRSGYGAHIWTFFDRPVLAADARRLGCALLTRTMEKRHEIGLDSYDRLFPSQDTIPKGGFGNLIALPLQKRPREQGNSVFLNELFEPHSDQWRLLESFQRISADMLARLIHEIAPEGNTVGVRLTLPDEADFEAPVAVAPVSVTEGSTNHRPTTLDRSSGDKQSGLCRKEGAALRHVRSLDSDCCFSKSRILQSSGHATLNLRQATSHILWREFPRTHRSPEGMPRRGDQNLQKPPRTNRDSR